MIVFKPTPRFVASHPAHLVAFGFGSGLAPAAPGTAATLLAWLAGFLLAAVPPAWLAGAVAIAFVVGIWACGVTGRHLGIPDHGGMVWDEIVAFLLIVAVLPKSFGWQLAGFALFRLFDIAKPPPIRWFERRFKGGFGVMFDDLLAAGYTLLVLAIAKRVLP